MSTLANPRHERFACALAEGRTADEAYQLAGYRPHRSNASRLSANDNIRARLAELLKRAAAKTETTVASLTERLLKIAEIGEASDDAPMLSVARAALMDVAKLNGLITDKSELDVVQRVIADTPLTDEEWADAHGADLGVGRA